MLPMNASLPEISAHGFAFLRCTLLVANNKQVICGFD